MSKVPFFSNTPDDTHCFQAAFKMVLKYFLPNQDFSWQELEKLSAKQPDMSTWPQTMLIHLRSMGFDVLMIEGFDAKAFIKDGDGYLKRAFGEEAAAWQIANSNIPAEQKAYQAALDAKIRIENRLPTVDEMQDFLANNYLVICTINSRKFNGQPGYVGHAVVICEMDGTTLTLHDPGLPPIESRRTSFEEFEKAWADPTAAAKNLIAVKYVGNE